MAPLALLGGGIVLLDQLTKLFVMKLLPLNDGRVIIPGFFNVLHVRNTGAAFSIMAGANSQWRLAFFVILTVLVLAALLYAYTKLRQEDLWTKVAYALICGGAAGNLVDRLRFGEVVDFLDVYIGSHHWPTFNVADSGITLGAFILILSMFRSSPPASS